jgi:hypothetical protein
LYCELLLQVLLLIAIGLGLSPDFAVSLKKHWYLLECLTIIAKCGELAAGIPKVGPAALFCPKAMHL